MDIATLEDPPASHGRAETQSRSHIEDVVRRHQVGIWRYLRSLGCDESLADDLLQETFVVALRRDLDDSGPRATATFLRRTAQHLFLRTRSKQNRRARLLAEAVERLWEHDCAEDDGELWLASLRSCVDELEGRAATVVHRFYRDEVSRAQLARELGMKETGVKTLLQRVRASLRACVERRMS